MKFIFPLRLFLATLTPVGTAAADTIVRPFLERHCYDCHDADTQKGDINLEALGTDFTDAAAAETWSKVVTQIMRGQMPPEKKPRPDAAQADVVIERIDAALVKAGQGSTVHELVTEPSFGNYVNHDLLFSGKIKGPAYSPSRIWRRSDSNASAGSFSLPNRIGIRDYAAEGLVDEPTLDSLIATLNSLIVQQIDGGASTRGKKGVKPIPINPHYAEYIDAEHPTSGQIRAVITDGFFAALQRPPTEEETDRYIGMLNTYSAKAGRRIGLKTTLTAINLNPEAIFRMELGLGDTLPDGRHMLSPGEIFFAVCLALGDEPLYENKKSPSPDHIHTLLTSGNLRTRDEVKRAVLHILDDPTIEKPRIYRFFHEFFSFQETETIFKDGETSYRQGKFLMGDGQLFIEQILASDRHVFEQLLTKSEYPFTAIGQQKSRHWQVLDYSYSLSRKQVDGIKDSYQTRLAEAEKTHTGKGKPKIAPPSWDFKGERAGMLSHPAWLYAWSTNIENHPVQRGKWVLENLLAGTVPEVPITVQAQIPEAPDKTLRERYAQTREDSYCWSCHKKMNPLGMTFETYSYMGAFQPQEVGKPVDASGTFAGTGIPVLDAKGIKVRNAVELMDVLSKEPRVRQSIIRHAFRYFMGRNETLSDSPTLIAADRAYLESDGSFNAVIAELLTSDSFLYRK